MAMPMAMATSRAASLASLKNILAVALLCAAVAASFLPLSSAGVSLVSLTCRKTAHERLCISTLAPDRRSDAAQSVQELAVVALTVARNSTRDAVWRTTVLESRVRTPLERDRLEQCRALYSECLRDTTTTIALVNAASYDAAARASSTLHWYPEKCQSLLYMQGVESAMEQINKQVEGELIASTDIVHLLLARRGADKFNLE
ncbi:cell wall / vacuolar inhibitor of fructosidase 2-like [Miscanthus floridulus]|uniref:cell wall / vacuolar inhibitor of fructosidase 2-like n=1 Tax=Miscanthus floridulus TaxID=154761 RepID=UPI00345A41C9